LGLVKNCGISPGVSGDSLPKNQVWYYTLHQQEINANIMHYALGMYYIQQ